MFVAYLRVKVLMKMMVAFIPTLPWEEQNGS